MSQGMSGKDYIVCDNCRVKKIRCGREKPSCVNCSRHSLKCEWSGQGKKGNQTALLTHTILGLSSRLENLESSVLDTQNSLKRFFEESSIPPTAPITPLADPILEIHTAQSPNTVDGPKYARPLCRFVLDQKTGRSERDIIIDRFGPELHGLGTHIQEAQNKLDALIASGGAIHLKDATPPTPPPFAILDAMIEPYFAQSNHHLPIWRKEKFVDMAHDLRDSALPEQEHASIVCCNNLILISLTANSLRAGRGRPANARKRSSIDSDFIAGFLTNAKRAIKNIELLLSPCLLNLQALLSLCAVALENLSPETFQSLFALASQCAKSIGVDQWQCYQDRLSDEDTNERRDLAYCLYILDKIVCWSSGTNPSITTSYMHIDLQTISTETSAPNPLLARTQLAQIEESIYDELYASRVKPKTEEQVRKVVNGISLRLEDWLASWAVDLGEVESGADISAWKLELAINFYCTQLLLIWPYKAHPDAMFQRRSEVSRKCMRLLLRLWTCASTETLSSSLPRLVASKQSNLYLLSGFTDLAENPSVLASHPPLYLHEIAAQIFQNTHEESDIQLLQKFTEMLHAITNGREEGSFNDRLCEWSLILMQVVEATQNRSTTKRRRTIAGAETLTPVSNIRSPPASVGRHSHLSTPNSNTLSSYTLSGVLSPIALCSAADQYLEGFDFPNWDDTFGLISPAASAPSESDEPQATADSIKISNDFGRGLLESFNFVDTLL